MREKENFTSERVAKYGCETGKQQSIYWDAKTPGLGLRVTDKGAKSYIFETRLRGKTIRLTIGDPRIWSIGKAQAKATEYKTLTDQGLDPRQLEADRLEVIKAKQAEADAARLAAELETQRQAVTMRQAWLDYIEARKHKWCPRYLADHHYIIAGKDTPAPLAALANLRLVDLTPERIADWLRDEAAKRPTSANIAFRKLRAFLGWCGTHKTYGGLASSDACKMATVIDAVPKQKAKNDCLQREQMPLWFAEVCKLPAVVSAYLRALLLTGARREELASLKWEDVDFQWNSLTIKDKVEGQRIIPLTPYVAALLADLKRRNDTPPPKYRIVRGKRIANDLKHWKPSQWVFSSRGKSGRIEGPNAAHNTALTAAGLPHVSLHGLRRSFKSLAEWVEMPVGVVAQIMGHKQSATAEKHYTVRPLDLLRLWHSRYESWLLEQAGIEQPKEGAPGLRAVQSITAA